MSTATIATVASSAISFVAAANCAKCTYGIHDNAYRHQGKDFHGICYDEVIAAEKETNAARRIALVQSKLEFSKRMPKRAMNKAEYSAALNEIDALKKELRDAIADFLPFVH